MSIKRFLLCGAAIVGLTMTSSSVARADINFGDLSDAFDDFGSEWIEQLLDGICAWLLMPIETPTMSIPAPLPSPEVGGYPDAIPRGPDDGIAVANEVSADQRQRVAVAEEIIGMASSATSQNAANLEALSALNKAAPVSVSAQIAIGNEAAIAAATADATTAQMMAAEAAMRSAQIMREEHARAIAIAQASDFSSYGRRYVLAAEHIELARP